MKIRKSVGRDFVASVRSGVKALRASDSCGAGGKERDLGCKSIVDPRDRISEGNVYKIHNGLPLFTTHDDSAEGSVISRNGKTVAALTYTGLNNPDPNGLRHHYRISSGCNDLPRGFYIRLRKTCYDIDTPCDRID